jgi:hypothetical protein
MDNFKSYLLYQKEVSEIKLKIINRFLKGMKDPAEKRTTKSGVVEKILRNAGKPMHVTEIMETAEKQFQITLERDSIVSIISKKIKSGKQFVRTAPNTFGLKSN